MCAGNLVLENNLPNCFALKTLMFDITLGNNYQRGNAKENHYIPVTAN